MRSEARFGAAAVRYVSVRLGARAGCRTDGHGQERVHAPTRFFRPLTCHFRGCQLGVVSCSPPRPGSASWVPRVSVIRRSERWP